MYSHWRSILLNSEPREVNRLCQTSPEINLICQDEHFYREYFYVRGMTPPPKINLAEYYFGTYLIELKTQDWLNYLKCEDYFENQCGIEIIIRDDTIDENLFNGIVDQESVNGASIEEFFESVRENIGFFEAEGLYPRIIIIPSQNKFKVYFYQKLDGLDFNININRNQAKTLIKRLLLLNIEFYDPIMCEKIELS